ncbi:hypothetical protein KY321_04485 [Candidatus Woesearchaeota archaeon]|nr:hypothetical protein [Candidatus Woesearchaeota archaeon]
MSNSNCSKCGSAMILEKESSMPVGDTFVILKQSFSCRSCSNTFENMETVTKENAQRRK